MSVGNIGAVNAYKIAQKMLDESSGSTSGTSGASGSSSAFGDMVANAAKQTISQVRQAEQVGTEAVMGKASLNEVVSAVNNADIALKTVIAVRDKVIMAYQDIIKMPI